MLEQARRVMPTVTSDWQPVGETSIAGVAVTEIKNVVYRNGVLTELFCADWFGESFAAKHIVHVTMAGGTRSPWHCHKSQTDVIFPIRGQIRLGLYDDRSESSTYRTAKIVNFNIMRPRYVVVPPGIWHALRNVGQDEAAYVVLNDRVYRYDDPDDWVLPKDSDAIPCSLD